MLLDDNGIIITNGDNDTYPLLILQYALEIKKKVVVVNINLITVDSYRKKLFEENKIPVDEFKALEQPSQDKIIQHLISRSGRPVLGTPIFAGTLRGVITGSDYMKGDEWVGLFVPPVLVLFGILLPKVGRLLGKSDERFMLEHIRTTLAARIE